MGKNELYVKHVLEEVKSLYDIALKQYGSSDLVSKIKNTEGKYAANLIEAFTKNKTDKLPGLYQEFLKNSPVPFAYATEKSLERELMDASKANKAQEKIDKLYADMDKKSQYLLENNKKTALSINQAINATLKSVAEMTKSEENISDVNKDASTKATEILDDIEKRLKPKK